MTEPSSAPPENQRVAVIYTGAVYGPDRGPGFGNDFQQPYFGDWLRWAWPCWPGDAPGPVQGTRSCRSTPCRA